MPNAAKSLAQLKSQRQAQPAQDMAAVHAGRERRRLGHI
jgi:hypothetical protein